MNVRNSKWPPELTRVLKNGAPLKWPQDWSNKQSQCVECEHPPSEHSIIEGGDRIKRVRRCPLRRTVLMGDEGSDAPVPTYRRTILENCLFPGSTSSNER